MPARKRKRTRFEYLGRYYLWHYDNWHVRLCSEDKKLVVAYFQGDPFGMDSHLEVIGQEFPGIEPTEPRPVRLCVPPFVTDEWRKSTGAFTNALIRWCVRPTHRLRRFVGAPHTRPGEQDR